MMFIDGENLTFRFQAMEKEGSVKRRPIVVHERDVFVWQTGVGNLLGDPLRIYYYTSVVGGEPLLTETRDKLAKERWFNQGGNWGQLIPRVYSKKAKEERSRHVDIAITIEVLRHALMDHVDVVWLVSGDRDFLPLIREVMSHGKRVIVAALSSGVHEEIPRTVDGYTSLDGYFFEENKKADGNAPS